MPRSAAITYVVIALSWIALSYSILFIFSIEEVRALAREDNVVEYLGAACFLLASITYFVLYKRSRSTRVFDKIAFKGNVFYLLLGLAFLFVCLEEISWGQRIIGFETPESIREVNAQREFNIHNLRIFHGKTETGERKSFWGLLLNMDRLFSMFWFSFCCLLPVLNRVSAPVRTLLERIHMPIVPMFFAGLFLFNYLATKGLELVIDSQIHHSSVEIKESNIALLFLLLAIWFFKTDRYRQSQT